MRILNILDENSKNMKQILKSSQKKGVVDTIKLRTKFDITSSAQNNISLHLQEAYNRSITAIYAKVECDRFLAEIDKVVIHLSLDYGLRISEILNLTFSDLLPGMKVLIRGLKHSNNRIISNVFYWEYLKLFLKSNKSIGSIYSRFYYYRLFRRLGISFEINGSSKKAVTHAGRHLNGLMLHSSGVQTEDIKTFIGHKNIKSTNFYIQNGKAKKG